LHEIHRVPVDLAAEPSPESRE